MPPPIKKVPRDPGSFRTNFTRREYEMLATALHDYIRRSKPNKQTPRARHYQYLLDRINHGTKMINRQLDMYRKANKLERCEYLEYEDRLTQKRNSSLYAFTKS